MEKELTEKELQSKYGAGVVRSIRQVFEKEDITKLTKNAYTFITLYMSFIAHYSLEGFRGEYANLDEFAYRLQTTEYSKDRNRALEQATQQQEKWYVERYGKARQTMIANTMREIVKIARQYESPLFERG